MWGTPNRGHWTSISAPSSISPRNETSAERYCPLSADAATNIRYIMVVVRRVVAIDLQSSLHSKTCVVSTIMARPALALVRIQSCRVATGGTPAS